MEALWVGLEKNYRINQAFAAVSERAKTNSGMDEFRKFTLWHMAGESAKLPEGAVLEVGCGNGGSGLMIAASARLAGVMDPIYLCDTFKGLVKADAAIDTLHNGDMADTSVQTVAQVIGGNGIEGVFIVVGMFPEEWPAVREDRFRFVHLDVDTYGSMRDAFEWVWPRVVRDGIVVIDDYGQTDCEGITRFVEERLAMPEVLWFLTGSGQAVAVKR